MRNFTENTETAVNSYDQQMSIIKLSRERHFKQGKFIKIIKESKAHADQLMKFIESDLFFIPSSFEELMSSKVVTDNYEICVIELEKIIADILYQQKQSDFILGYEESKVYLASERENNLLRFIFDSILDLNAKLTSIHEKLNYITNNINIKNSQRFECDIYYIQTIHSVMDAVRQVMDASIAYIDFFAHELPEIPDKHSKENNNSNIMTEAINTSRTIDIVSVNNNLPRVSIALLPADIFKNIVQYLSESDANIFSLVSKRFYAIKIQSNLLRQFLHDIYCYKFERDKRYSIRNIFYIDHDRVAGINQLASSVKSFFSKTPTRKVEFGYERVCNYYNVYPDLAKDTALKEVPLNELFLLLNLSDNTILQKKQALELILTFAFEIYKKSSNKVKSPNYYALLNRMINEIICGIAVDERILLIKKLGRSISQNNTTINMLVNSIEWNEVYHWSYGQFNKRTVKNEAIVANWESVTRSIKSSYTVKHKFTFRNENMDYYTTEYDYNYYANSNLKYFYPARDYYKELRNINNILKYIQSMIFNSFKFGGFISIFNDSHQNDWFMNIVMDYDYSKFDSSFSISCKASLQIESLFRCLFILKDIYAFLHEEFQSKLLKFEFIKNIFNLELDNFAGLIVAMLVGSLELVQKQILQFQERSPKGFMKYLTNTKLYLQQLEKISELKLNTETCKIAHLMFKNFLAIRSQDDALATNILNLTTTIENEGIVLQR